MRNFLLVSTFMALGISIYFSTVVEDAFGLFLILTIGVLHGSNDLVLIKRSQTFTAPTSWKNLIYYIIVVLTTALFFYFIPQVALPVFVLFSAYHFGEQHWGSGFSERNTFDPVFYTLYGLFIFCMLFSAHGAEVDRIIYQISSLELPEYFFAVSLLFLGGLLALFFAVFVINRKLKTFWVEELFYLLVFFVVFNTATLLWSFAVYFVLWHSLPSLKDQILFLFGSFDRFNILRYLKSSWPYWVVSVMALGGLLYLFRGSEQILLALFFSFLAAITFPHVLVIARMHGKDKPGGE